MGATWLIHPGGGSAGHRGPTFNRTGERGSFRVDSISQTHLITSITARGRPRFPKTLRFVTLAS